jgi:hypothetical protein
MIKLEQLKQLALVSGAVTRPCGCALIPLPGWERVPPSFPETQMRRIGLLYDEAGGWLSYQEYHPSGTNYWSEDAPVALHYYPYNGCSVQQCAECERVYLRYAEGAGHHMEQRIRALSHPLLISDEPLALT